MRKTLTILALLSSLAGFNQILTQTVNTSTTTVNNQTVITTTVLTTNTVASYPTIPMNNFFVQIPSQTAFQGIDNNNNCFYLLSSCISCSFGIQHTFTTTTFDSAFVSITASSNLDTNYYEPNTIALLGKPVLTLTTAWQTYSASVTNTNAASNSFVLTYSFSMSSMFSIWLKDLNIVTYSTSIISNTLTAPTNTNIATEIKHIENSSLNLSVLNNVIKSNSEQVLNLKIFDLVGKEVLQTSFENSIQIDLNNGIYFLQVFNQQNNLIENKRIIINQ